MTEYEHDEALRAAWWAFQLRSLRRRRHLSLSDVKALFDGTGDLTVSIPTLSRWETTQVAQRRTPTPRYRRRVAEVYGWEVNELFSDPPRGWMPVDDVRPPVAA